MRDGDVSFRDVLLPAEHTALVKRKFKSSQPLRSLHEELDKHRALHWPGNLALVANRIGDLLDVGICRDVLAKVWDEAQVFHRYLDRDRFPPNETIAVPLAEHTITSTHHPYLEVRFDATTMPRIEFELTLTITLKGVIVEIRDRHIIKIRTGECGGKVELKCAGKLLASEKLDAKRLPGEWKPEEPIPIAA